MKNPSSIAIISHSQQEYDNLFGNPGKEFEVFYQFAMQEICGELLELGETEIITGLRGCGDVWIPRAEIDVRPLMIYEKTTIHCILPRPGDECALPLDAHYVWVNADTRRFAAKEETADIQFQYIDMVLSGAGCLLSFVHDPETNPFHLRAMELGMPVHHFSPKLLCRRVRQSRNEFRKICAALHPSGLLERTSYGEKE